MKFTDGQTLEVPGMDPATLPAGNPDSTRHSDTSSGVERSQSVLGNAAVADATRSGRTGGSSTWLSRSAMQQGFAASDLQQTVGNSAIQWALRSGSIQAKLTVSQPGDMYEQEADQVAKMVMRVPGPAAPSESTSSIVQRKCAAHDSGSGPDPKCSSGQEMVQRRPLFSGIASLIHRQLRRKPEAEAQGELRQESPGEAPSVSSSVESKLSGTHGSGQPLPTAVRDFFEPRFGADFSRVRVHTGGDAIQMNRDVGARAFSHGSDIYFGAGSDPSDLELTAHELTHVVQQTGGGEDVTSAEPVIQRAVATNGGSFDTTTYTAVSAPTGAVGEALGVDIILEFTANDLVESTKIGMIQSVKAMKSSEPRGARDTSSPVSDPDAPQLITGQDQVDPNRRIDRILHPPGRTLPNTSPIYGVQNTPAKAATPASGATPATAATPASVATALGHGTPTTLTSQWGSHTKDPVTGAFLTPVPARIDDKPRRSLEFVGQTWEHTFEATAIAIEGPIPPNTYLGSVSWGWRSDAAGKVTPDSLALVRVGAPSAAFMAAAALWNAAVFHDTSTSPSTAYSSVDIPITTLNSGTILASSRATSDLVIQIARLTAELASMPAGTDKTNKEFEKRVLEAEFAKRADQPTLSLADQERNAALLSTPDLLGRSDVLPAEILALPKSPARTDRELEQEAVKREIAKRRVLITVHVHETEDIIGSDSVYVIASSGSLSTRTSVVNLNNGQEHTFVVPLSTLFVSPPGSLKSSTLSIRAYDEDWEGDDLMFDKAWIWSNFPAEETQSRDGGKYTVKIDFAQLR